jgi:hypothetical protein
MSMVVETKSIPVSGDREVCLEIAGHPPVYRSWSTTDPRTPDTSMDHGWPTLRGGAFA